MFTENKNALDLGDYLTCTCIETHTEDLYDGMSIWRLDITVKNMNFVNSFIKITKDLHEHELAPLIKFVKNNHSHISIYTDYYSIVHIELNKNILSMDFRLYNYESFDTPIKDFCILTLTTVYTKSDFY